MQIGEILSPRVRAVEKRRVAADIHGGSPRTYTRILQSVCLSFSARVRVSYVDLLYARLAGMDIVCGRR